MRIQDLLSLSTRMFRTRALRTALTILGMSVGIGTIVFLVSLGYGLQSLLLEQITTSESLLSLDVFPSDSSIVAIDEEALEGFRSLPNVVEVISAATLATQGTVGDSTADATATVTEPGFFRLSGIKLLSGNFYQEGDPARIIISATLAELFNWNLETAPGKQLSLTAFYKQDQIFDRGSIDRNLDLEAIKEVTVSGVIEGEGLIMYFSPELFPEIVTEEFTQAKVRVTDSTALEPIREDLAQSGYSVLALSDVVDQANAIFNVLQIVLAVFGTAALIVSAIGMVNTMTITFLERTQEIGIMRSIGASRIDMFFLFLIESAVMGFLGGVGGVLIGYFGQGIITFGLDILANRLGGVSVDIFETPIWFILTVIIFSTIVGFITGILPGRRARKLNPLDALRYK